MKSIEALRLRYVQTTWVVRTLFEFTGQIISEIGDEQFNRQTINWLVGSECAWSALVPDWVARIDCIGLEIGCEPAVDDGQAEPSIDEMKKKK